jgi:Fe-S cluster assembly iron-binding protein IscA
MALDEQRDNDEVFNDRDLKYIVEKGLYELVKPIKVDYVNSYMGQGFEISSSLSGVGASCGGGSCSC